MCSEHFRVPGLRHLYLHVPNYKAPSPKQLHAYMAETEKTIARGVCRTSHCTARARLGIGHLFLLRRRP